MVNGYFADGNGERKEGKGVGRKGLEAEQNQELGWQWGPPKLEESGRE